MLTKETIDDHIDRIPESGCWIWMKYVSPKGYGTIYLNGKTKKAHRAVFELFKDSIPDGLQLDHLCRVRCCVNPAHLEPVTNRENQIRGFSPAGINARKTHCNKGHEFTEENTMYTSGGRFCRICHCKRNCANRSEKRRKARLLKQASIPPLPKESKESVVPFVATCVFDDKTTTVRGTIAETDIDEALRRQ